MHSSVVGQAEKVLLSGCYRDSCKVTRTRSLSEEWKVFGKNDRKRRGVQKKNEGSLFFRRHWAWPVIIEPGAQKVGESIRDVTPRLLGKAGSISKLDSG